MDESIVIQNSKKDLNPKTTASNVYLDNGKTVEAEIEKLEDKTRYLYDKVTTVSHSDDNGDIIVDGNKFNVYTHPESGVEASTYTQVTVDKNGHVISGDNPTTLEGYGITDAVTSSEGEEITNNINTHKSDTSNPHNVTKAQIGLGSVENKTSETIRGEITKDNVTTALGYTPYTPNEVDNKISKLLSDLDWKESVATVDDIATTYPNPQDGWTVNVKDTNYTYRYDEESSSWIVISINAIPKSTNNVDGLLSKEDHVKYEDANSKKHTHDNKTILDNTTASYTTEEKTKLSGIDIGANKTTVDSSLSTNSTNPVQNKVVTSTINKLCKILTSSATVATSAWTAGSTYYEAKISNSNITASVVVNGSVDLATKSIAENAGVINITESFAGYFKIYSKSVPSGSINISYTMLVPNT